MQTPFGVTDLIPDEAYAHSQLLDRVSDAFKAAGYERVRTPSIEYLDSLKPGLGPTLEKSAIKFFDSEGQVLILRPDHTTPIARMVATRMQNAPLPLKLSYLNSVFRNPSEDIRQDMETFQAGCECIGDSSPSADAELIAACVNSLKKMGLEDIHVVIGHSDIPKQLSDDKRRALLAGNYVAYGEIPVQGDISVVNDIPNLVDIHTQLAPHQLDASISYSRGIIKGLGYYTGMVFDCYAKGIRRSVASGGRYDELLAKFGYPSPAVGFVINVTSVFQSGDQL